MIQDLNTRTEDLPDRRVRRIGLTRAGSDLIGGILDAGTEHQRRLLSRLSADELDLVERAPHVMVRAATEEMSGEVEGVRSG